MRQIAWELADGFPLDQGAMKFLQDESFDRIKALATYWANSIGSSHFIITGMVADNKGTISAGWCWLNDKLLYYAGGSHPGAGAVVRPVLQETEVEYEDTVDRPAYKYWTATVMVGGTGEGFFLESAKRVPKIQELTWANLIDIPSSLVFDANYVHTDNNFTNALLAKLNGIAAGAEVNVQSDWEVTDPNHDAYIKNKPAVFSPVVVGEIVFGYMNDNWPTAGYHTVTGQIHSCQLIAKKVNMGSLETDYFKFKVEFEPVADTNYEVMLQNIVEAGNSSWELTNGVLFSIGEKTTSSFTLIVTELILCNLKLGIKIFR